MASHVCETCGVAFESPRLVRRFCSRQCFRHTAAGRANISASRVGFEMPEEHRAKISAALTKHTPESRRATREAAWIARRRKVKATPIDKLAIYERDGWQCQLCGDAVDPTLRGTSDRLAPSLDHIVPLVKGGEHVPSNVQLAHLGCNSAKGAREAA